MLWGCSNLTVVQKKLEKCSNTPYRKWMASCGTLVLFQSGSWFFQLAWWTHSPAQLTQQTAMRQWVYSIGNGCPRLCKIHLRNSWIFRSYIPETVSVASSQNKIFPTAFSNGWFPKAMDLSRHRFVDAYATSSNSPTASKRAARDNDCEGRNAGVGRVWGKAMVKSIFLGVGKWDTFQSCTSSNGRFSK